jgi:hypothetical protein
MEKISIELSIQAWNVILNALGQRPYIEVFEVIDSINRQGKAAMTPVDQEHV